MVMGHASMMVTIMTIAQIAYGVETDGWAHYEQSKIWAVLSKSMSLQNLGGSGCTPSRPCDQCQGDCDRHADCKSGHKCFQRSGYEQVPGCSKGGSGDKKGYDYCYKFHPEKNMKDVTTAEHRISAPHRKVFGKHQLKCAVSAKERLWGENRKDQSDKAKDKHRCTECDWQDSVLLPVADFWSNTHPPQGRCQGWGFGCSESAFCYEDSLEKNRLATTSAKTFSCVKNCLYTMQSTAPEEARASTLWATTHPRVGSIERVLVTCKIYKQTKCKQVPKTSRLGEVLHSSSKKCIATSPVDAFNCTMPQNVTSCDVIKKATCEKVCRHGGYDKDRRSGKPIAKQVNCKPCSDGCEDVYNVVSSKWCTPMLALW